jgi:glycopeptide antibiotics resistance protein
MLYCLLLSPIYFVIRGISLRNKAFYLWKELWNFSFFLFTVAILSQTIIPSRDFFSDFETYQKLNLVPFQTINIYIGELGGPIHTIALYNLLGNILLFIPFGFFIPSIWIRCNSWGKMLLIALFVPFFIETTQYFIGRSVDVDDVILNTLAIIIGYILYIIFSFVLKTPYYKAEKS